MNIKILIIKIYAVKFDNSLFLLAFMLIECLAQFPKKV